MPDIVCCPECNVPELISQSVDWLNNGDIVQKLNPQARMGFIESENFDPLFHNMGQIIGISIEPMIMNIAARGVEAYMKRVVPQQARDMMVARQLDVKSFAEYTCTLAHVYGFGKYEALDYRYERDAEDYAKHNITKPFSLPLAAGAMAGTLSSMVEGQYQVAYKERSPSIYEFKASWTEYPEELMERFDAVRYEHRDGDIEFERCGSCGMPKVVAQYRWLLEEGQIVNESTGRRMVLLAPGIQDLLFLELEKELGDTIPKVVVEAQRRFTKTGFYSIEQVADEGDFRTQLALRGLGNLRDIKMRSSGVSMHVDNAAGYLMAIGMIQGVFETAFGGESDVEWALSEMGDLEVEIKPKA
jgi:hypothetical protein